MAPQTNTAPPQIPLHHSTPPDGDWEKELQAGLVLEKLEVASDKEIHDLLTVYFAATSLVSPEHREAAFQDEPIRRIYELKSMKHLGGYWSSMAFALWFFGSKQGNYMVS